MQKSQKVALITGGNRGIGFATAHTLALDYQMHVLVGAREETAGQQAAQAIRSQGGQADAVLIDMADPQSIHACSEFMQQQYGPVSALVNNAGVLIYGGLMDGDLASLRHSMEVHVFGCYALIKALLPGMIEQGYGRIVNVSSGWGSFEEGLGGPVAYAVSKAALNALSMRASRDLPPNIKMNAACPGWVRTRMGGDSAPRTTEEGADTLAWLATLPDDGPNGGFFRDRRPIDW